jgi:SAM-dependent methyltransferase
MSAMDLQCPVCGGTTFQDVLVSANGFPIIRCRTCSIVLTDGRTAPPAHTLYPAFDQSKTRAVRHVRSFMSVFLRQRAAVVQAVKKNGRLLDFGCGNGAFARFMSMRGFDAVGLEPFSLGSTLTENNLQLIQAPLQQARAQLGEFDVITLWHVLEHLTNPVQVLETLSHHLRPEGLLIVSVPNFRSWQSALFKGTWFHLDPPRHLIHFEPDTLSSCLQRAGLEKVAERRFLPEYGASGWVQSALNGILPHGNYLYEFVKDRGALRNMSSGSSLMHFVGSVVAGVPLAAVSLPVEAVASAINAGAALTFAARRSAPKAARGAG